MKIVSFSHNGRRSYGLVFNKGIVDLGRRLKWPDAKSLIAHNFEGAAPDKPFTEGSADLALADVDLEPPIPNPMHIIGVGLNTKSHFVETEALQSRTPGDYPKMPRLFLRSPLSLVGSGSDILVPRVSTKLDYEAEVAVVIGKPARYVSVERALDHIAGYACANDGSVRDYQFHSTQITAGKNFPASGAWGPWLVTADEVGDPKNLRVGLSVNGEPRQDLRMDDLLFSFAQLVSYASEAFHLQPGDVILTGSPEGVGAVTGKWLKPGDHVAITSPQLGSLMSPVAAEPV